ncbi:MAG: hypothetical protein JNK05_06445 [Myxococcales bacterium]|nr:hypothetical protein [Myxococcales bacterium]
MKRSSRAVAAIVVALASSRASGDVSRGDAEQRARVRAYFDCVRQESARGEAGLSGVEACSAVLRTTDPALRAIVSWINARTNEQLENHEARAVAHALECVTHAAAAPSNARTQQRRSDCVAIVQRLYRRVAWVRNGSACEISSPSLAREVIAPAQSTAWTPAQPGATSLTLACTDYRRQVIPVTLVAGRRYVIPPVSILE